MVCEMEDFMCVGLSEFQLFHGNQDNLWKGIYLRNEREWMEVSTSTQFHYMTTNSLAATSQLFTITFLSTDVDIHLKIYHLIP